jgi:site-specific DNA recombinase
MKVAVYARVSTEHQADKQTIQLQLEFAQKFCELHKHEIVGIYADEGISGTVPMERRPEGARMLDAARSKRFDALLVYRLDRLARSVLVLVNTIEKLEAYGVAFQSMTEAFDTSKPGGRLSRGILALMAEFERDSIYERTVGGRERAVRSGKYPGGGVPFGYKQEGDRLVINEPAAEVVRDIFRLYLEGRRTIWIAAHLTSHNVPLPSNWTRPGSTAQTVWNPSVISRFLSSTVYKGEYRFRKRRVVREDRGAVVRFRRAAPEEHIVVPVPAIVDADTFDRVQILVRENKTFSKRRSKREYALRGLVMCGGCGRKYIGHPNGPRFYYVCASQYAPQLNVRWCGNRAVRAEQLERTVWEDICAFIRNPGPVLDELTSKLLKERPQPREVRREERRIEKALAQKREQRERVVSLYRKGWLQESDITKELRAIQEEERQLELERGELLDRIKAAEGLQARLLTAEAVLEQLREYADLNEEEPNTEIIRLLVYGITIKGGVALADYAFYEKRDEEKGTPFRLLSSTHSLTRM